MGDISKAVMESKKEEFVVECVGILGNLNLPELDWAEVFKHFEMLKWVEKLIKNNTTTDPELILQVEINNNR